MLYLHSHLRGGGCKHHSIMLGVLSCSVIISTSLSGDTEYLEQVDHYFVDPTSFAPFTDIHLMDEDPQDGSCSLESTPKFYGLVYPMSQISLFLLRVRERSACVSFTQRSFRLDWLMLGKLLFSLTEAGLTWFFLRCRPFSDILTLVYPKGIKAMLSSSTVLARHDHVSSLLTGNLPL